MEDQLVVLVVEDDQEIQSIVEDALTEGGFEPAIAPSGEEAVTLLRGNKGSYRALVADVNLRGKMDGWEVAKQAREIDPEFPVIYMTGAGAGKWPSRGVPNSVLLEKPFAPAQLVTAVSQLLISGTPKAGCLRDSEKRPQPGGRLGPVEPVRDVPYGRERHGHTILRNANCSSAPGRFFCEPARIANSALSHP